MAQVQPARDGRWYTGSFFSQLGQHLLRQIEPPDLVSVLDQRKGDAPCATAELQHGSANLLCALAVKRNVVSRDVTGIEIAEVRRWSMESEHGAIPHHIGHKELG